MSNETQQPSAENDCLRVESYRCMCGGTRGCGCRLTDPPTHFHGDGRRLGSECPIAPASTEADR